MARAPRISWNFFSFFIRILFLNYHFQSFLLLQNVSELLTVRCALCGGVDAATVCSACVVKTKTIASIVIIMYLHNRKWITDSAKNETKHKMRCCDAAQWESTVWAMNGNINKKKFSEREMREYWMCLRKRSVQMIFINHIYQWKRRHIPQRNSLAENACIQFHLFSATISPFRSVAAWDGCDRVKSQYAACLSVWHRRREHQINLWLSNEMIHFLPIWQAESRWGRHASGTEASRMNECMVSVNNNSLDMINAWEKQRQRARTHQHLGDGLRMLRPTDRRKLYIFDFVTKWFNHLFALLPFYHFRMALKNRARTSIFERRKIAARMEHVLDLK